MGLDYVALGQPLSALSGGERQRIRLTTELHREGSTYVLDEPTSGLHASDVRHLLQLLDRLVDGGAVRPSSSEHHLDVAYADWVIDMGPKGIIHGGRMSSRDAAGLLPAEVCSPGEHLRRASVRRTADSITGPRSTP